MGIISSPLHGSSSALGSSLKPLGAGMILPIVQMEKQAGRRDLWVLCKLIAQVQCRGRGRNIAWGWRALSRQQCAAGVAQVPCRSRPRSCLLRPHLPGAENCLSGSVSS